MQILIYKDLFLYLHANFVFTSSDFIPIHKPEERLVYPIHILIVIFGEYLSTTTYEWYDKTKTFTAKWKLVYFSLDGKQVFHYENKNSIS